MTYLKGKDIKQQGDCLVYCYTRRIEVINIKPRIVDGAYGPEDFKKW